MTELNDRGLPLLKRLSDYVGWFGAHHPEREACVFEGGRLSYAALDRRVDACAKAMAARGIGRGDRVATLSTPRPEYLVTLMAADRLGATWVGLNPVYQLDEHATVVADAEPRLLFGFAELRGRDNRGILAALRDRFGCLETVVTWDDDLGGSALRYDDFIRAGSAVGDDVLAEAARRARPDDAPLIVYTSGSTGRPKGAMLTHRNLVTGGLNQFDVWPCEPLRAICNLPTNHVGCNGDIVSYVIAAGGTLVFHERFDAEKILDDIETERVTWLLGVPTMYQAILAAQETRPRDLASLQVVFFAGAAMPKSMVARLRGLCPHVFAGWGMTETTVAATYSEPGDDDEVLATTVGRPSKLAEVGIMDEAGRLLEPGESGELVVRGPIVTPGYFRRPEATQETIDERGWLHTGDTAVLRRDGRVSIVGRIKEMFKSGGYNVYPREIETVIEGHRHVEMAAVVPASDPRFQEIGVAFVMPSPGATVTAEEIESHCRERLAGYKIPKLIVVRDELPKVEVGKVDRVRLKKEAAGLWPPA